MIIHADVMQHAGDCLQNDVPLFYALPYITFVSIQEAMKG
jgi:hypothetical protein